MRPVPPACRRALSEGFAATTRLAFSPAAEATGPGAAFTWWVWPAARNRQSTTWSECAFPHGTKPVSSRVKAHLIFHIMRHPPHKFAALAHILLLRFESPSNEKFAFNLAW